MKKQLFKSSMNRILFGVCGGIGEYFDIDPTIIRLIWVILTLCGFGAGVPIYIIAAIIVPDYR